MHNKMFKRSIAFLISLIMIFSILPLNVVFANLQSHIRDLTLQYISSPNDTAYNINFSWTNPPWSTVADGSFKDTDAPSGYRIEGRNTTARETSWTVYDNINESNLTSASITSNLQTGSIYEFRVTPYHYHNTDNGNISASYDSSTTQETFLFMTDIEVDAKGSGNNLTITFDNPQYMGQNIFEKYVIYYQRGSSEVTNFTTYTTVNVEEAENVSQDASRNGVQRLTFTINDSSITQGDIYAIKVEPLYDNAEVRDTGSVNYKVIRINDEYKKITFKSKNDKEYRVDNVSINIPLSVQEDGQDFLKLIWSSISNSAGAIEKIEIYSGETEENINSLLGTIYSSEAIYVNTWKIENPRVVTYYKLLVYISGAENPVSSEIAVYNPGMVNIKPNKPNLYLYDSIINNQYAIDIYWDVFLRYPYTNKEEDLSEANGTYIDTDITYDLWISDNIYNLNNQNLPKTLNSVPATDFVKMSISDTSTPVYNYQALEYITVDNDGNFVNKAIEGNKTYYVKIVAKKPVQDSANLYSDENIAQIYIPINTDISTPQTISKPPLKIKTDDDGNEEITQTSITIEWKTAWFEIFDEDTNTWYTNVAIRNGNLVFGDDILETDTLVQFYDKYNEYFVIQEFITNGLSEEDAENLVIRYIDLSSTNINYEIKVIDFETIEVEGGYETYLESLLNDEDNTNWTTITPSIDDSNNAEYTISNLNLNTLYAIILRPYRIIDEATKEAYPTYILGTTLPEEVEIIVTPVIPQLYEVSHDDVSSTLKWNYQGSEITYELAVSEVNLSDPSTSSLIISPETISEQSYSTTENSTTYINYKIDSLFPETGYYIWIRAIHSETGLSSDWSSYLYITTDSLNAPDAPSGFGLASLTSINYYNSYNNTDYVQADEDYIIVEWIRDENDTIIPATPSSNTNAEALFSDSDIDTYMVLFKDLVANKYYYFRAKTKLTIVKTSTSYVEKYYSYIVEASLDKDFKDAITIEVPTINVTGSKVLSVESEWTETYHFKTTFTKDDSEYDGTVNDSLYPLPTDDFEIIYDTTTSTLTYRLRSNKTDANGNDDNLVDQRFISKLLQNKVYDYSLDLTSHNGYTIKKRVIEIPYTIFKAFEERKINLHLTSVNTTFVLTPGFLNTSEVQALGYDSIVRISIEQSPSTMPTLSYGQTYSTTPQKISISILNDTSNKELSYTGSDMEIILKLKNRYLATDTNVSPFIQTSNTSYWQRLNGSYNSDSGSFTIKSKLLATYTTISTETPTISNTTNTQTLYDFNNKIYINDIINLDLTQAISVVQFNNLVAAVANNKTETSINTALNTNDYTSLKRSNLLLEGSVVSREQGVNVLVRLYEIKTKTNYQNYTTLSTTSFKDIANASTNYQTSLLKASEIGFFGDETTSRPKSSMTIEEALYMLNIILADSGF